MKKAQQKDTSSNCCAFIMDFTPKEASTFFQIQHIIYFSQSLTVLTQQPLLKQWFHPALN